MRILYICTGNSFRSPLAEALTRRFHPDLEVESRGTAPAEGIAGNLYTMLGDEQIHLKSHCEPVVARALEEADKILVMEEGHKTFLKQNFPQYNHEIKVTNWDVPDPITGKISPADAYCMIRDKVKTL